MTEPDRRGEQVGGGGTGGRLQHRLIDTRSAATGPSWSLKEPSWMRTHGGQRNTPVQTRQTTTRRCEEDEEVMDAAGEGS